MSKIETPVMTSLQTTAEKMMKDLNVPGAAVAVQFCGEVRPDGADNRPVAVSAISVPAPDHHAVAQATVAQICRPVGTAYRVYGLVYLRHQSAGVRLCGFFQ